MKTRQSRRQTAKVSHSRWLAYATAGAATALGGSHSLEAAIHYSGRLEVVFPRHETALKYFQLDKPGDSFWLRHVASASVAEFGFPLPNLASEAFRGTQFSTHGYGYVSKLSFGQRISVGQFANPFYGGILADRSGGQWADAGVGFIGFRFNSGAGIQYGWARVRMGGANKQNGFKLIDYAYADPGQAIRAGEDGQDMSDEQGPDEGSLGGLALGAVGLLAWRKSRSRTARSENA